MRALEEKHMQIPYRDSQLTCMLRDSLGGSSKTLMITCVSSSDLTGTKDTLKFAEDARSIENKVEINKKQVIVNEPQQHNMSIDAQQKMNQDLHIEIVEQQKMIDELQKKLLKCKTEIQE